MIYQSCLNCEFRMIVSLLRLFCFYRDALIQCYCYLYFRSFDRDQDVICVSEEIIQESVLAGFKQSMVQFNRIIWGQRDCVDTYAAAVSKICEFKYYGGVYQCMPNGALCIPTLRFVPNSPSNVITFNISELRKLLQSVNVPWNKFSINFQNNAISGNVSAEDAQFFNSLESCDLSGNDLTCDKDYPFPTGFAAKCGVGNDCDAASIVENMTITPTRVTAYSPGGTLTLTGTITDGDKVGCNLTSCSVTGPRVIVATVGPHL